MFEIDFYLFIFFLNDGHMKEKDLEGWIKLQFHTSLKICAHSLE